MTSTQRHLQRAREFWNWFQTAPLSETRDSDCKAKLAALLAEVENEALERAASESERRVIEFSEIDVLDTTPEKLRIARRIRALKTPVKT